ncbi:alkaline phosphatase synthesis sensor protein PhoR [Andreesenia angusta]|uniref:Heme sensor protein HssS n=1 Tax=Andreesenia angusta TaxID=39480 RepID=A0A1S1V5R4_9FIRM|nr:HAMP domain-containing sensor histidine kinase [Andreesenia angusta]OHW62001.1 alkaline phosphatase synthesis sensor protein PhoR [Andreesenia angusta]
MNRRTLNLALVVFVFLIMACSAASTGLIIHLLYRYELISDIRMAPTVLSLVSLGVSIVIGTTLALALSRKVLKPLNELIEATREVARGNFEVEVEELDKDNEIGELVKSFNYMTRELKGIGMFHRDFINNFSHELKTPIASIRGFAKQLQNSDLTDEQRKEYAEIIVSEAERLTNMSSNILLLTKLENQEIITGKEDFFLDEQIRSCILLLQQQWEEKNIDFELDLDPLKYFGNEEMLSYVWTNIISNAIKFSEPNSSISIRCAEEMSDVKVNIKDEGIGMDDKTRVHIFEKFYQGDSSRKSEGNGLGLSLVKRVVELCGGRISVKSQIGKGSEFIVRLPKNE